MNVEVLRTCTEVLEETGQGQAVRSGPLKAFREVPAYVLLGDPGSGKSTSFEAECEALGDEARYVTARDFLTFDLRPEWRSKILFIDGLDEVRAGSGDVRTPFDAIRQKLDYLESPRFRLSCRGGGLARDERPEQARSRCSQRPRARASPRSTDRTRTSGESSLDVRGSTTPKRSSGRRTKRGSVNY